MQNKTLCPMLVLVYVITSCFVFVFVCSKLYEVGKLKRNTQRIRIHKRTAGYPTPNNFTRGLVNHNVKLKEISFSSTPWRTFFSLAYA